MSYTRQYLTGSFIHKTVIHHKASFQICKLIKHGVISKTIKCKYLVNDFIVSVPIVINILTVITYQYLDKSGRVQLHGEFTPLKVTKGTLTCRLKGFNTWYVCSLYSTRFYDISYVVTLIVAVSADCRLWYWITLSIMLSWRRNVNGFEYHFRRNEMIIDFIRLASPANTRTLLY